MFSRHCSWPPCLADLSLLYRFIHLCSRYIFPYRNGQVEDSFNMLWWPVSDNVWLLREWIPWQAPRLSSTKNLTHCPWTIPFAFQDIPQSRQNMPMFSSPWALCWFLSLGKAIPSSWPWRHLSIGCSSWPSCRAVWPNILILQIQD